MVSFACVQNSRVHSYKELRLTENVSSVNIDNDMVFRMRHFFETVSFIALVRRSLWNPLGTTMI